MTNLEKQKENIEIQDIKPFKPSLKYFDIP
jgi:hypothetical protein